MSQAELFAKLHAPLNNTRWSWGSVRESDGAVFLRVWQDTTRKIEEKRFIWVSKLDPPADDLGANERLRHVKLVEEGHCCYLVMCEAVDAKAVPRAIKTFNRKELFETGEIRIVGESYWIELGGRISVREVAA